MIFDLHNDFPTKLDTDRYEKYCASSKQNITAVIWTTELSSPLRKVAEIIKTLYNTKSCGCLPLALEDLGFLYDNNEYLTYDYSKLVYGSLTWNYDNAFAGGASDSGDLTAAGKALIKLMNGKCAVDLAHLNRKSFFSALDLAERPCCSHTGFNSHRRSLDDEQIRALIARRAVIGLCTVTAFTDASNATEFMAVIDRYVQKYGQDGVDCLAFGTDFCGSDDIPEDLSTYTAIDRLGFEMLKRGYGEENVNKIKYQNAARFCGRG